MIEILLVQKARIVGVRGYNINVWLFEDFYLYTKLHFVFYVQSCYNSTLQFRPQSVVYASLGNVHVYTLNS